MYKTIDNSRYIQYIDYEKWHKSQNQTTTQNNDNIDKRRGVVNKPEKGPRVMHTKLSSWMIKSETTCTSKHDYVCSPNFVTDNKKQTNVYAIFKQDLQNIQWTTTLIILKKPDTFILETEHGLRQKTVTWREYILIQTHRRRRR